MTTLTELRRDCSPEAEAGKNANHDRPTLRCSERVDSCKVATWVSGQPSSGAGASKLWSRTVSGREGIFLSTCEDTSSSRAARGGGETVVLGDHQSTVYALHVRERAERIPRGSAREETAKPLKQPRPHIAQVV